MDVCLQNGDQNNNVHCEEIHRSICIPIYKSLTTVKNFHMLYEVSCAII